MVDKVALPQLIRSITNLVLVIAISQSGLAAQDEDFQTRYDRFRLYTACSPVELLVTVEGETDDVRGLTEQSIEIAVRSRLRSARIYTDDGLGMYIHAHIIVAGLAFSASVDLRKELSDPFSGEWMFATTWGSSSTGTHGRDAQYLRGVLSEHVDRFIDDYLRVNEAACANR